jgi:hypothetical protein
VSEYFVVVGIVVVSVVELRVAGWRQDRDWLVAKIEGWTSNWKSRMVMCDVRCAASLCRAAPNSATGGARASGFGAGGEEVNDVVIWRMDVDAIRGWFVERKGGY